MSHAQACLEQITVLSQQIGYASDLDGALAVATVGARRLLGSDRVLVYHLMPDGDGVVMAESVDPQWQSVQGQLIYDPCFETKWDLLYAQGRISVIADVATAHLAPCYLELLTRLQVRANLVVPIVLQTEQQPHPVLWGLLIAQQCGSPRQWQSLDIQVLRHLAMQVGCKIHTLSTEQPTNLQNQLLKLQLEQVLDEKIAKPFVADFQLDQADRGLPLADGQIAIRQIELYRQMQQQTAQLQQALEFEALLKRITDKVRDSLDEQEILQSAVQELAQGLDTLCCDTGIYNADRTTTTIAYEFSDILSPAKGKTFAIANAAHPAVYDSLLQGQTCQFCSVASNPLRPDQRFLVVLACPLVDDQGVLGDLWLFKPSGAEFNDQEVRLVQQVANQCAIALRQSRLYRAIQGQVEELARLNQLKDDFLSTVSHELRAPIASMKMAIQMLDIRLRPLGVLEPSHSISCYFQILQTECQREMSLINDLLDLARIDSDLAPLNLSPIQLKHWITHVSEPFLQRTADQGQHLKILIPDHLPPLTTDSTHLERILTELLHNAFKYTPSGEVITVSAGLALEQGKNVLRIAVSNSGIEISEIERDRVFDKFYRIPKHDPWKHGGTGLGLPLVKKLVERLGGVIWLESGDLLTQFILQFSLNS